MFEEGDIVEIPLPDGRTAVGWLLYTSKRFTHVVGLIVFGIKGELADDVIYNPDTTKPRSMPVLGPIYTSIVAMKHYGWTTVAHQAVSESKRVLTKRRVGRNVYVGDDLIGSVEDARGVDLPQMSVLGMPLVYQQIENAYGKVE